MMNVLIVSMILATAIAVALPLLRRVQGGSAGSARPDLAIYRDQLAEVERDQERGLLDPGQAEAVRLEVQRRMLAAVSYAEAIDPVIPDGAGLRRVLAVLLVAMVSVGSLVVYSQIGSPGLPDRPHDARLAERLGLGTADIERLNRRADQLQTLLSSSPDDPALWREMAQVRQDLGAYGQAVSAWSRRSQLAPMAPDDWASFGESLVQAEAGLVGERAQAVFTHVLALDRKNPRARWFLGLSAVQSGEPERGLAIWLDLARESKPGAPWMKMLNERVKTVAMKAGLDPDSVAPRHPADLHDASAMPSFTEEERTMVTGMVDRLRQRLADAPDDAQGWQKLGRSLTVMGDASGAAEAYGKAADLLPGDPVAQLDYATALVTLREHTNNQDLSPRFHAIAAWFARHDPDSPGGLFVQGISAEAQGKPAEARSFLERLLALTPPGSAAESTLRVWIDRLAQPPG
ncbi:c-type cytochrome biogenesis protein CcmI [Haematospirillum jordaniae]|uniref:Cytochrome c-type biogenesis protein H TPR domain-containing protein n=1 Tax=Haematospirillum jordaniae TaxID=1549855 RepID=A0A143DCA8_9PROT|nr:c-type cytochrome biogenesis protein CcmI [Haematospirillum jordaniae]AMW34367.1 hypothetical protein AY555_03250 [Haematospirillum jordaniae]NKD44665.1 c-type cytochrome biogenesis protein CcmI [Haematospirillum jordaniae]NKD57685.1 c-type cytochrome biogenesis protein CcmI [Haematospirillum jordaniae]NKD59255.1 c-type cytochrome biogenesis protein CcmI [Haematospirillum jordaniae]NKD67393.1 c-type cytochrome biogenesis protein CcmI [Haematospirillum jordaniae]